MPPPGSPRPDADTYHKVAGILERRWIAHALARIRIPDGSAPSSPQSRGIQQCDPRSARHRPRCETPAAGDDTADGSFDNFADSLSISTAHLERYMSVARQVTRLATGLPPVNPTIDTYEIPLHVMQEERQSEDLPFGSRGGIAVNQNFRLPAST